MESVFPLSPVSIALAIVASLFIWLLPHPAMRILLLFWCLPLFYEKVPALDSSEARMTVFDVGQGLSVLIETTPHRLLYDAGRPMALAYLQAHRIHYVDRIIVSHHDADHRAGVGAILGNIKTGGILTSAKAYFPNYLTQRCHAGQEWVWDGVAFRMLWPGDKKEESSNENSCVLQVCVKQHCALLPGDIEAKAETELIRQYGASLKSEVLIAPHHGSVTSSSWGFIKAVLPKIVIFSTGFFNRFHFPSKVIVSRYRRLGTRQYNTADYGQVTALWSKGRWGICPNYKKSGAALAQAL